MLDNQIMILEDTDQVNMDSDFNSINTMFEAAQMNPNYYESVSQSVAQLEVSQHIMKLENITKIYANGTKAVNGLNLKLYTDQVFVLLGHNGAGKTSTLDIITGLYNPTDGNASIFGVDMFKDFQKVRQFMGICPQHDVLFDLLTPQEHLEIFYDFKSEQPDEDLKREEIQKIL